MRFDLEIPIGNSFSNSFCYSLFFISQRKYKLHPIGSQLIRNGFVISFSCLVISAHPPSIREPIFVNQSTKTQSKTRSHHATFNERRYIGVEALLNKTPRIQNPSRSPRPDTEKKERGRGKPTNKGKFVAAQFYHFLQRPSSCGYSFACQFNSSYSLQFTYLVPKV